MVGFIDKSSTIGDVTVVFPREKENAMLKNLLVVGVLLGKLAVVGLAPQPAVSEEADCPYCPTPTCFPADCWC